MPEPTDASSPWTDLTGELAGRPVTMGTARSVATGEAAGMAEIASPIHHDLAAQERAG